MRTDIKSMYANEIEEYFIQIGEREYRAQQVYHWLHNGVKSFDEMTNLPKTLRERLSDSFYISNPQLLRKQQSTDGTIKYLWNLCDDNNEIIHSQQTVISSEKKTIESVLLEYEHGLTLCISTQIGCVMGCVFCASTIGGLVRNLKPSEMLDQVIFTQADVGKRISNVVLMGMGEPLDNLDNVIRFIRLINHSDGLYIGTRHITISTCGIIENIDKLAKYDIQSSLAVSLHAPDDETRSLLLPINKQCGIDELLAACDRYFKVTGRRVTYEYALIDGVNDTDYHAQLLAKRLSNSGCHVNLIQLSNVRERGFSPSPLKNVKSFAMVLKNKGVNCTIRRKLGSDIDAACGQLRRREAMSNTLE